MIKYIGTVLYDVNGAYKAEITGIEGDIVSRKGDCKLKIYDEYTIGVINGHFLRLQRERDSHSPARQRNG